MTKKMVKLKTYNFEWRFHYRPVVDLKLPSTNMTAVTWSANIRVKSHEFWEIKRFLEVAKIRISVLPKEIWPGPHLKKRYLKQSLLLKSLKQKAGYFETSFQTSCTDPPIGNSFLPLCREECVQKYEPYSRCCVWNYLTRKNRFLSLNI